MRFCSCLCLVMLSNFYVQDAATLNQAGAGSNPKIYVDISEAAQKDAVSFGGARGLFGLCFIPCEFCASIANSGNNTENKVTVLGIYVGMEYSKEFHKGFLIAVDVGAYISKNNKKGGNWSSCNEEYEKQRGPAYPGRREGELETDSLSPNLAVKGGYVVSDYGLVIFIKGGISKTSGAYRYKRNGAKVCEVGFNKYLPSIGLGAEKKVTPKFGVSLEANLGMEKTIQTTEDSVAHKIKVRRKDIRIMGTYTISS